MLLLLAPIGPLYVGSAFTFLAENCAMISADNTLCPCGQTTAKGQAMRYSDCCGRYVENFDACPAPDAERLMRSRYSAFVRENAHYLQQTWHPSQRPTDLDFDTAARWLGLQIKDFVVTGESTAEVEFVARYRVAGRAVRLHERSRFVHESGRWYYVDGDQY